jgi:Fe-S-cluster containining protein
MAEINRIVMYSGLGGVGGREFAVRRSNSELFVQKMVDLFPDQLNGVYRVFPIHGQHYELLIEDERCTFHGPCGCELPRDVRPLFCRLYPFWFYGPDPYVFANDQCLALGECRTVQELCLALGTNLEHLHGLYAQLLLNWGFYPEQRLQAAN